MVTSSRLNSRLAIEVVLRGEFAAKRSSPVGRAFSSSLSLGGCWSRALISINGKALHAMCHGTNRTQDQSEECNAIMRPSTAVDLFDTYSFLPPCPEVGSNVVTSSIDICRLLHGRDIRMSHADSLSKLAHARGAARRALLWCPRREGRANPTRCS